MSFQEFLRQDVRLVLLRVLAELPQRSSNSSTLQMLLGQWNHHVTRQQVKEELYWLQDRGLVTLDEVAGGDVLLVRLTARGQEVADDRLQVAGVKRPGV